MNGADISEEINRKIEYENSKAITVRIAGDEKAVTFISNKGDYNLKATDKITIEFKLNDAEYTFMEWKVSNLNDETKDCSASVKLYTTNSGRQYKTELTLLDNTTDIALTAACHLKPAVSDTEPKYYPTGVSYYRPIKITFNKPINKDDLSDLKNIKIANSQGASLQEYFNTPVPSEDKKTYTITPIKDKIKDLLNSNTTYDITVTIAAGLREIDTNPEVTKETNFSYRIANIKDTFPPQISSLNVYTTVKNLENDKIETKELKRDILPEEFWTTEENRKYYEYNHITGNSVKIKFTGTDDESGIKALYVKEVLLHNKDSQSYTETYPAEKCEAVISEIEQNKFESNTFTYELRSKNDGLISLEFYIADYDDHISDSTFCGVTRDLESDIEFYPHTKEESFNPDCFFRMTCKDGKYAGLDVYEQLNDTVNNRKQGFSFPMIIDTFMKPKNARNPLYNKLNFRITYKDEGDADETEIYFRRNALQDEIVSDLIAGKAGPIVRNPKKDTYVKFYLENAYDQSAEFSCTIPKALKPQRITGLYNPTTYAFEGKYLFFTPEKAFKTLYFYQCKGKDEPDSSYGDIKYIESLDNSKIILKFDGEKTYRLYMMYTYDGIFYSCADDELQFTTKGTKGEIEDSSRQDDEIPLPKIREIICTPNPKNTGTHSVKIIYDDEGSPDYEYTLVYTYTGTEFSADPNYAEFINTSFIQAPSNTDFIVKSGFNYAITFDVKDPLTGTLLQYSKNDKTRPNNINATYDNIAPTITKSYMGCYKHEETNNRESFPYNSSPNQAFFYLDATDNSSGIDEQHVEYWIHPNTDEFMMLKLSEDYMTPENKKILDITGSNLNYFNLDISKEGFYTLFYKVLDNNGNYAIGQGLFSSVISGEISNISEKSGNIELVPTIIPKYDDIDANPNHICTWYYDSGWKITDTDIIDDKTDYTRWSEKKFILNFKSDKEKFFKISTANNLINGNYIDAYTYNKTLYIIPEYILDSTKVIKKKSMLETGTKQILFISTPTMVRTLYSSEDWGDDAALWGTRGIEADVVVENSDFTYIPVKNKVPDQKYWCIVANYADGTCDVSKVQYKP